MKTCRSPIIPILATLWVLLAHAALAGEGNVFMYEAGGNIEVAGDTQDNEIIIEVLHNNYRNQLMVRFKGIGNTTINEHASIERAVSNLGDLIIDMQDGGVNRIYLKNLVAHQADAFLQVSGAGNDYVQLDDSEFDRIEIDGVTFLVANDCRADAAFSVEPTPYRDLLHFNDCQAGRLDVETGYGSDLLTITGGLYNALNISTGVEPLLRRQPPATKASSTPMRTSVPVTDPDADDVQLNFVTVNDDLDIRMGMGDDELELQNIWVLEHTLISGGTGTDEVNLYGNYDASNQSSGTQVEGGFNLPIAPPVAELPVNPTIDIIGFESVLNFDPQ